MQILRFLLLPLLSFLLHLKITESNIPSSPPSPPSRRHENILLLTNFENDLKRIRLDVESDIESALGEWRRKEDEKQQKKIADEARASGGDQKDEKLFVGDTDADLEDVLACLNGDTADLEGGEERSGADGVKTVGIVGDCAVKATLHKKKRKRSNHENGRKKKRQPQPEIGKEQKRKDEESVLTEVSENDTSSSNEPQTKEEKRREKGENKKRRPRSETGDKQKRKDEENVLTKDTENDTSSGNELQKNGEKRRDGWNAIMMEEVLLLWKILVLAIAIFGGTFVFERLASLGLLSSAP